ncbi:uncharacterized protein LOC655733 [Tribolium castaneum]|uniref:27 kDa hemolymph protein-like Protein n=1 Tax=Tribolium castaneum TaxID=7070 RepID=D6X0C3_TRICA|nr:PREDICTED: uncharacterized protein LOC655733 [Tribolium castaneum]EFA09597.1 hypothetical protein TcasGA2_TC011716 [Tribolium castaneum]|eukprot:XP_975801.1 PREDICTED: uncharacterized protein LOC655733 [Tribolium castaneum]
MKITSFLVVAGLVLASVAGQQGNSSDKISRFIYDRCRVYSTDASAYDDIKTHLGQFGDYLSYAASLLPNGKEQFCNDERPTLARLAAQLAHDVKPCLPKDEKYLPKFMVESFTSFLDFVCSQRTIENFFSTQGADCRQNLKLNQEGQQVGNCFTKLFARFSDVVRKDDLCLDLKASKKCFSEAIARSCPDFAAFESLNNRFFQAIRKPCNSAISIGFSSVLLLLASFTSTKLFS